MNILKKVITTASFLTLSLFGWGQSLDTSININWIIDTIYIAGDAGSGGDGSLSTPHDSISDITWENKKAYLFKRGYTYPYPSTVEVSADSVYVGSYGTGDKPVLNGNATSNYSSLSVDAERAYFENICFRNQDTLGRAVGASYLEELWFNNCEFSYSFSGLKAGSVKKLMFLNSRVHNTWLDGLYTAYIDTLFVYNSIVDTVNRNWDSWPTISISGGDCIQGETNGLNIIENSILDHSSHAGKFALIMNNSDSVIVRNSTIISHDSSSACFMGTSNNGWFVDRSTIVGGGYGLWNADAPGSVVESSVIRDCRTSGINGGNISVYNSTFANIPKNGITSSETGAMYGWGGTWKAYNNIIYNCHFAFIASSSNVTASHNNFYNDDTWGYQPNLQYGDSISNFDPEFSDYENRNFSLDSTSQLIDIGADIDSVGVLWAYDRVNNDRVINSRADIGAFEYTGDVSDTTPPTLPPVEVDTIKFNVTTPTYAEHGWVSITSNSGTSEGVTIDIENLAGINSAGSLAIPNWPDSVSRTYGYSSGYDTILSYISFDEDIDSAFVSILCERGISASNRYQDVVVNNNDTIRLDVYDTNNMVASFTAVPVNDTILIEYIPVSIEFAYVNGFKIATFNIPSPPLDSIWHAGYVIDVDTFLMDSASGEAIKGLKLNNIDFELTYLSDSGFIPLKTKATIELPNNDSLNLSQFSIFHRNYNYDSLYFFDILKTDTNNLGALTHPMRISRIKIFDRITNADAQFNVIPYSSTWRDVPNESGSLVAAHAAISPTDTIIVRSGSYSGYTFTKSHTLAGCGDVVFSETFLGTTTASVDYVISGIYGFRSSPTLSLFAFQSTGGSVIMNNVYADGGFDANNLIAYDTKAYNCYFNGDLDMFYNCGFFDCLMDSTYRMSTRGDTYVTFNRCNINGYYNSRNIVPLAANGELNFNWCSFNNGGVSVGNLNYNLNITNCNIINDSLSFNFINTSQTDIYITDSYIEKGKLEGNSSNITIDNCTLVDFSVNQQSSTSSIYKGYLTNSILNATENTFFTFVNSAPRVEGNTITSSGNLSFGFYNNVINDSSIYFQNNDIEWSYSGSAGTLIFVGTDSAEAFRECRVLGNHFKVERHFGVEPGHHLYLNSNTPSLFSYNYVDGAILGTVVKNYKNEEHLQNIITYNIYKNCGTPIFLRSMPQALIYNNEFSNPDYALSTILSIDDNVTDRNSDSCQFINNLINSTTGYYLTFGASADSVGFISSNNINYNSLLVQVSGSPSTFAEWQALGYDVNSLIDTAGAAGNGYTLGIPYDSILISDVVFPNPELTIQGDNWDIGARKKVSYITSDEVQTIHLNSRVTLYITPRQTIILIKEDE